MLKDDDNILDMLSLKCFIRLREDYYDYVSLYRLFKAKTARLILIIVKGS